MKLAKLALGSLLTVSGFTSMADVSGVASGSRAEAVANVASNILSVTKLRAGGFAYQIVSLDSELNGDLNSTTMVLVGENGVGGAVGFDAAFQLTPTEQLRNFKSARTVQNEVEISLNDQDGKTITRIFHFDSGSKSLIESSSIFKAKHLIHSNGKAYTECVDAHEQLQSQKGRKICVNHAGDYYFIAN